MCHMLRKKKKESNTDWETNQNKRSQKRASRSHAHQSPSDALLWINTRSGVEKGNGVKLREARKDEKHRDTISSSLARGRAASVFDARPETRRARKHKAWSRFSLLRRDLSGPAIRHLSVGPRPFGIWPFPPFEWSTVRVPIPLISGKLSGQKCLKVKLGEMEEEEKRNNFDFLGRWANERGGGRERGKVVGGGTGVECLISDDFFFFQARIPIWQESVYAGKQITLHRVTLPPNIIPPWKWQAVKSALVGIHLKMKKKKPWRDIQKKLLRLLILSWKRSSIKNGAFWRRTPRCAKSGFFYLTAAAA